MNTEKLQLTLSAVQKAINLYQASTNVRIVKEIEEGGSEQEMTSQRLSMMLEENNPDMAKKVIGIALMMASKEGLVTIAPTSVAIASMSDEIIERIRVATQVGKGILDPEDAASRLVDRAAVRLIAVADHIIVKGVSIVAEKIVQMIGMVYPPASVVAPVVRVVVQMAAPMVKKLIHKGIRFMAETSKRIITTGINQVRVAISRVREALA